MVGSQKITLRDEPGPNSRWLSAELLPDGELRIRGEDAGPRVQAMLGEEETEWGYTFPPESAAMLARALGGTQDSDLMDLLDRQYSGTGSYVLERIIRDTRDTIPRESHVL